MVGELRLPGVIEVSPNTPLNQAVLAAGGFYESRVEQGTIEVVRLNYNGTVTKQDINVDFAREITEANNPILLKKDVVVVNHNILTAVSDILMIVFSAIGALTVFLNFFKLFND